MSNTIYTKFLDNYSGKELLKKYSLSEKGTWRVRGEDPNCDMGGHHYQPELGVFEGTLEDVLMYVVELPSFWTWGYGGSIEKISPPTKVNGNSIAKRKALQEKLAAAEALAESLKNELKNAG